MSLREESPEHLVATWSDALRAPATLVLRDACYPGWTASITASDGAVSKAPIECTDVMFRAVSLPAGARSVEFTYEPTSLRIGAALSALGLLVWAALLTVADRLRR